VKQCWVMTDGRPGNENPALGLAEAVARLEPHTITTIKLQPISWWLPAGFLCRQRMRALGLTPPWPDMAIGCGRRSAPAIACLRALSRTQGNPVYAVQLLKPPMPVSRFDLVIAPEHDRLEGENVISSVGSLSRVTDARLTEAKRQFPPSAGEEQGRVIAVLIGGSSRRHKLTRETVDRLIEGLKSLNSRGDCRFLVTTSRRTGPEMEAYIRQGLTGMAATLWDGQGANPYYAFLARADAIVVTSDSVNMISEAAATGKPVYIHPIGGDSTRLEHFHRSMTNRGITRPFDGLWQDWSYPRLDETARVAELLIARQKKCRVTRTRQV